MFVCLLPSHANAFWVVNFGPADTLAPGRVGFAAGGGELRHTLALIVGAGEGGDLGPEPAGGQLRLRDHPGRTGVLQRFRVEMLVVRGREGEEFVPLSLPYAGATTAERLRVIISEHQARGEPLLVHRPYGEHELAAVAIREVRSTPCR
jgi:hypothetical protein